MSVRVVTDSTSDITPEMARDLGIEVVPLKVHFGDEVFLDGVDLSAEEFYQRLIASRTLPTTSQPPAGDFIDLYRRLSEEGVDIVSIHISAKFSGTLNSAHAAKEALGGHYRIEVVDSLQASMGLGLIVMAAAEAARDGASLDQVAGVVQQAVRSVNTVVMVDTLEYLYKGGRIGKAEAFLGGLLSVKPIIKVHDGEAYPLERPRTWARALERLHQWVTGFPHIAAMGIMHSTTLEEAVAFSERMASLLPPDRIHIGRFGPVIGTYVGPGALGVTIMEGE